MDLSKFKHNNKFLMLAIDHRESFKKLLGSENIDEVIQAKREIITVLKNDFSGVLIDVEYGLPAYSEKTKPYLLSIEKSGYLEKQGGRITELQYSVEELKKMGAAGIKLLLYYDHDSVTSLPQMETAQKVLEDCRNHGLPLFLEIVTYNNRGLKHQQILSGISLFLDQGLRPDVFKLEYPDSEEYCKKITSILGSTPWILLTRGEDFNLFEKHLEIAVSQGAQGFLAGRSLWQEIGTLQGEEKNEFLKKTLVERFRRIAHTAEA